MIATWRHLTSLFCSVIIVVVISVTARTNAANLTWDGSGTHPAAPVDGTGLWDTAAAFWTSGGASDVVWDNASTAVFGAGNGSAPYTVTIDDVSGTVSAGGLTFNSAGTGNYTIAASGGDTLTLNVLNPIIGIAPGVSAAISAPIAGAFNSYAGGSPVTGLVIKDTGSTSTGTFTLSGINTYTGSTVIESNGTANTGTAVVLSGNGSLGSASANIYIAANPTATATDTSSLTLQGTSSITAATLTLDFNFGEGTISTTAGGVLNVNGTNTINANTITTTAGRNSGNTKGGFGKLVLGNGATLTLNDAANDGSPVTLLDIANYSFESGGSTGTGTGGTIDFSAGTVNGSITTINIATSKAGSGTNTGTATGTLLFANGNLNATTINIARKASSSHPSNGTLTLAAGGTGTLTAGNITFGSGTTGTPTGTININGATLTLNGDITSNAGTTAAINLAGGALNMGGHNIGDGTNLITLNATAGTLNNVNSINGTGGLTMSGSGPQVVTLTGTNSYTGATTVNGGTLVANGPASMGAGGALAVNNAGKLDLFGNSQSVASLSGTGSSAIITNSVASPITLMVTNGVGTSTYAGLIQDGGVGKTVALTISGGSANLTSATSQIYTGNTTVGSGASLTIANINSPTTTTVNGTLAAAGTVGTILVDNGGSLTPGPTVVPSGTIGTLNGTSLTIGSFGGNMNFLANSAVAFDKLVLSGAATLNGVLTVNALMSGSMPSGTYDLVTAGGGLNLNGNTVTGIVTVGGGGATRLSGNIIETSTKIQLQVSGNPANLTWADTGAASGDHTTWDIVGQKNWTSSASANPNQFFNQDNVTFDNSVSTSDVMVNITADVKPGSVTFNNDAAHNYVFNTSAAFGIDDSGSGTSLTLNGLAGC